MFQKGNTFGKKSSRGQAKISIEVKERLKDMTEDVYKALHKGIIAGDFNYIQLWFNYVYGKPQMRLEIKQENRIMQINFNEGKEVEIIAPIESINSGNNL